MRRILIPFLVATVGGVVLGAACGAENAEAPPAENRADIMHCRSFGQLMPNFVAALSQGRTENLKTVVEKQLLKPEREGDAPPVNDVLRAIFKTLSAFAAKPPEAGASAGEYCAPTNNPPPLERANELCEMRRSLDVLVHQGKGIDAIGLLEPQIVIMLNYLTGRGLDCKGRPRTPHYEVSSIISGMCSQNAQCQLNNGLDLLIAFTAYSRTPDGKALMEHLNALASKQSITGLLDPSKLTESDTVAIVRGVLPAIQNADAVAFENAFNNLPLPQEVKDDLRPVVEDLKKILGRADLVEPMKKGLNCYSDRDKNLDLVRMVYRVALEEKCPEFGLTRLTEALKGVQEVDQRGSLMYLAGTVAVAIRNDETAVDSTAKVCQLLFSTSARPPNETRSNAELALPVAAELVQAGLINEGICAADTLIFGCAGGMQPACR